MLEEEPSDLEMQAEMAISDEDEKLSEGDVFELPESDLGDL